MEREQNMCGEEQTSILMEGRTVTWREGKSYGNKQHTFCGKEGTGL